ncbi:hypothetical protein [Planomonospora venezuelensis]|uniref:Uncharacterized protein n=1 Tax=Planomonospora venezuelensis TaxID=1999 RepID=A0A841DB55_PLAVE|nr:hypothetical protein [Planomonospora venezuelensis]MBB5966063.1 hypothetical protein [Planomonospora venezuelensis]GIN03624.1 hypothetical protein Pve01_52820 [Planomonospora venezuelensis]
MNEDEREKERARERESLKGTTFDPGLHDMGGDIGPASIRGSNAHPGGRPGDDAEPRSGWSRSTGYVAGRDDERPGTAGSDEKAVGARTDEIEGRTETAAGPSPHPMPADETGPVDAPDAGRRAKGPVEGGPDDDGPRPSRTAGPDGGHVGAGMDWVASDEDDPDAGSGRTAEGDGGYLPGEGTGRPAG